MIEAHAHTLEGAFALLPYVGWFDRHRVDGGVAPGIRTYDALLDRLRELDAATAGSDEPIVVGGFDPIYFRDEAAPHPRAPRPGVDRAADLRVPRQRPSRHGEHGDARTPLDHPRRDHAGRRP